ncbi:MAG: hypothetical protein ACOYNO_11645 [Saprospiraceae bacterium]
MPQALKRKWFASAAGIFIPIGCLLKKRLYDAVVDVVSLHFGIVVAMHVVVVRMMPVKTLRRHVHPGMRYMAQGIPNRVVSVGKQQQKGH